jgi:DNA-directed RNA polymerase specialized sigma24 family protein
MADTAQNRGASPNQNLLEEHCTEILDQLARAARKKIRGWPIGGGDEHDIALSAMRTFIRRDKELKIAELHESKDLLHMLLWITARKVADKRRQQLRPKYGGGRVLGSDAMELNDGRLQKKPAGESRRKRSAEKPIQSPESEPEHFVDTDLTSELNAECARLLDLLDGEHRAVALLKLQGYSNDEIKQKLGWSKAWVERKLRSIRECWGGET